MTYKTLSLFTGAGGLDTGFAIENFDIVIANEIDKNAAQTYKSNHENTQMIEGDIKNKKAQIISLAENNIDVVIGGPSCQGFSVAGKMDINDPRNTMIWEFLDIVEAVNPKIFVMENVKALASLEKWKPVREKIIKVSSKMGFHVTPIILNSKHFGVPQKRERVFFIGTKEEKISLDLINEMFNQEQEEEISVLESIQKFGPAGTKKNPFGATAKISLAKNPIIRKSPYAGMLFNGAGRPINIYSQSNTLPASMGGNRTPIIDETMLYTEEEKGFVEKYHERLIKLGKKGSQVTEIPSSLRRITVKEASAIQTFPENYIFVGPMSSQYKQIGNAVPCKLASAVARVVKKILSGKTIDYEVQLELELEEALI